MAVGLVAGLLVPSTRVKTTWRRDPRRNGEPREEQGREVIEKGKHVAQGGPALKTGAEEQA